MKMQTLDDYLETQLDTINAPEKRFVIESVESAEWSIKKIHKANSAIKDAQGQADEQINKINAWLKLVKDEQQDKINYYTAILMPYAMSQLEGSKKKSMKLPSGTIGFRKGGYEFHNDEEKLLAWAKENAVSFVKTKESVAWGDLKKVINVVDGKGVSLDGEVVEGIVAIEKPDSFYVKGVDE